MKQFIFSNKTYIRILRHFAFWLYAIGIIVVYHETGNDNNWEGFSINNLLHNLASNFSSSIPFSLITLLPYCYFVVYYLSPKFLLKNQYKAFIIYFILVSLAEIAYVISIIYLWTKDNFDLIKILTFYPGRFVYGPPITCLTFLALKLFKTWYAKEEDMQMLNKAKTQAEMELLKAQINPHFLFNTLNNIYSLALNKSPKAIEVISGLHSIMQYMINDCNKEFIALDKEIQILKDYIELEKVRYGKRLCVLIDIEGSYENKLITPLLMIPFVENSFKHGTSKMLRNPWMKMFIQADENFLHFTLSNNKPADEIVNAKGGFGLNNVKKRLELLYPSNHLLAIEPTTNTFTVNIRVPLQQMDNADKDTTKPATIINLQHEQ